MKNRRLLAIDPSLTCSGWALFLVKSGKLLGVGKIRSLPPKHPMPMRLGDLQSKIKSVLTDLQLAPNDVLVCEAQTTMRDPRAAFAVEQVRGMFETIARELGVTVPGRINPRSVHYEILGLRGKQLKREIVKATAVSVTKTLYGSSLKKLGFEVHEDELKKHQDVIDAILLGSLGLAKLGSAEHSGISLEKFFSQNRKINNKWV